MVTLVNRAKVATATTGTGTITLGAAESGYQTFADAGVADADVVRYVIEDGTDWEIGTGTYTASGTTLSRTVLESSNADAALNLTGSAVVYVSATAEDIVQPDGLATVATTGDYDDLSNKPTIPAAYTDSDVDAHLNTGTASSGEVLSWTGSDYDWIAAGGGGAALELYAENPSSPTAPSATGTNAVAIGNQSIAAGTNSIALGGSRAGSTDSFAASIANNSSFYGATSTNAVAMGSRSKASGSYSFALGRQAITSGTDTIAIGNACGASGYYGVAIGNGANSSGGFVTGGNVSIGSFTSATQVGSIALGRRAYSNIKGKLAVTNNTFTNSADGSAQFGLMVLKQQTSTATPATMVSENNAGTMSAPSTTNQIILPNNSAYAFHGTIVARQQASQGTACAAWKIEGLIRREGSAGTTVLVNSATTVLDNTPAWGMALSANTTNGGLKIEVTGAAAANIRWVATINTSEVTY